MKYIDKINPFMNVDAIKAFSDAHGDLANNLKNVIHVAGTNGKGSTIAFLRAILESSGYSVNIFTSPHLVNENERIRIKGKLISDEYNKQLNEFISKDSLGIKLSIFERFVSKALIAFNKFQADFNILEVGLGGRLDATNIVDKPLISIITPIDLDHQHMLGNTKTDIAIEKAAIIKKNCLVVSAYQSYEVLEIIKNVSTNKNAPLVMGGIDWLLDSTLHENKIYHYLNYKGSKILLKKLGLRGKHQLYNASLAIVALKEILVNKLTNKIINLGLNNVEWPGRLQSIDSKTLYNYTFNSNDSILLDGAHNTHGADALLNYINEYTSTNKIYMIMSMLKTKNLVEYLRVYKDIKNLKLYSVSLASDFNAYSSEEIKCVADSLGINSTACLNVEQALNNISKEKSNKLIILCGSLYFIGKVMQDNSLIPK